MLFYQFLNIFFFVFHTLLILFNVLGWLFKKTRLLNLVTLLITGFSWFILGIWYKTGYCFLASWHWAIRKKLGYAITEHSYIKFLLHALTGFTLPDLVLKCIITTFFLVSLLLSIVLNSRDLISKRREKHRSASTPQRG